MRLGNEEKSDLSLIFSKNVDIEGLDVFISMEPTAVEVVHSIAVTLENLLSSGKRKEAKVLLRTHDSTLNTNHERPQIWKSLCQHQSSERFDDYYYWDTVKQLYGTKELPDHQINPPSFVDVNHLPYYGLSENGRRACDRVVSIVGYSFPSITYSPLIYPLTAAFLHYLEEGDAYSCISTLINCHSTLFIDETKLKYESMWKALETISKKHVRGSFSMLAKLGLSKRDIHEGYQNWIWWIFEGLPLPHLVRVLDCFLLEGYKVLIRIAVTIFKQFLKMVESDSSNISSQGFKNSIITFASSITSSPSHLLSSAFGIRGLSRTELDQAIQQAELNQKHIPDSSKETRGKMARGGSLEDLPTSESQANFEMLSHTLAIKELISIWSWLPMRMTMMHPELLYTTEEHGSSITTFYQRVEQHEPTLLLIRSTCDSVFGAYCSTAWKQRNLRDGYGSRQTYFGTGETFIFSLNPPIKYEWLGIKRQKERDESARVEHSEQLFQHADSEMISVGGGKGHGLMLDSDFQFGKTETCSTFANRPLCENSDFSVKVVEVYGFSFSKP